MMPSVREYSSGGRLFHEMDLEAEILYDIPVFGVDTVREADSQALI
jgi:hypothetical protein